MTLRFEFECGQLAHRSDVLAVDGVFGTGRNLSHWPGNRTPERFKHDLTTGMALRLAAAPDRSAWMAGIAVVANNHLDTDGLLSAWSVLHPEAALAESSLLLNAAAAGDFQEVADASALRFDAIVSHWDSRFGDAGAENTDEDASARRHARVYDELLPLVPQLLHDQGPYEALWRPRSKRLMRRCTSSTLGVP